jgi:hypothetical protein
MRKKPVGGNFSNKSVDMINSCGNDFPRDTMRFWANRAKAAKWEFLQGQGMPRYAKIFLHLY